MQISMHAKEPCSFEKSRGMKKLVRRGIPNEYRGEFWKAFAGVHRVRAQYSTYYYASLTASATDAESQAIKEIERDVFRTFPGHRVYGTIEGSSALRRILVAFSRHKPCVGYCQSLNYLVAMLLLFMHEEDAFWTLETIVSYLLPPAYYTLSMLGARGDAMTIDDLVKKSIPNVWGKIQSLEVELQLITVEWLLCLFVNCMSLECLLRVWDVFFYEGSVTLFRVALALLRLQEPSIVKENSYHEAFSRIRNAGLNANAEEVFKLAFGWPYCVPRKVIASHRKKRGVEQPKWTGEANSVKSMISKGIELFKSGRSSGDAVEGENNAKENNSNNNGNNHSFNNNNSGLISPSAKKKKHKKWEFWGSSNSNSNSNSNNNNGEERTSREDDPFTGGYYSSSSHVDSGSNSNGNSISNNNNNNNSSSSGFFASRSRRGSGDVRDESESNVLMNLRKGTVSSTPQRGYDSDPDEEGKDGLFRAPDWFVETQEEALTQCLVDDYDSRPVDGVVFDQEAMDNPIDNYF